jgi:hypothetical protein
MNRFNSILAGVFAVQAILAAAIWLRPAEPGVGKLEPLIPGLEASAVERVSLFDAPSGGVVPAEPSLELLKEGGAWVVTTHHSYPADGSKVDELLTRLGALQTRGPMSTLAARQPQLSVADSDYERRIELVAGGQKRTLLLGGPAGARKIAARLKGSDEIHAVTGITASAVRSDPGDWIVTEYFSVPAWQVGSLSIASGASTITLSRDEAAEGGWRFAEGAPAEAEGRGIDPAAVDRLLTAATRVQAAAPAPPDADLSSPLATITLRMRALDDSEAGLSSGAEEHVIRVAPGDSGRYLVGVGDDAHPVYVRECGVRRFVELDPVSLLLE